MSIQNIIFLVVIALVVGYFYKMKKPKYNKGISAPNFIGQDLKGQSFELKDFRGKYVYLDFWGSWCGPCRAIRPHLVKVYEDYHDQSFVDASGFEVISVAMERKAGQWRPVAEQEGMTWPHQFSTLQKEGQIVSELYGVKSIPSGYFIGPEGQVLLNRPQMSEMSDYLSEKLSK